MVMILEWSLLTISPKGVFQALCSKSDTAPQLAQILLTLVFRGFDMPTSIAELHRLKVCFAKKQEAVCVLLGPFWNISPACHPQSDWADYIRNP